MTGLFELSPFSTQDEFAAMVDHIEARAPQSFETAFSMILGNPEILGLEEVLSKPATPAQRFAQLDPLAAIMALPAICANPPEGFFGDIPITNEVSCQNDSSVAFASGTISWDVSKLFTFARDHFGNDKLRAAVDVAITEVMKDEKVSELLGQDAVIWFQTLIRARKESLGKIGEPRDKAEHHSSFAPPARVAPAAAAGKFTL